MGKLKRIIKENLEQFILYVWEKHCSTPNDLEVIKNILTKKATPYKIIHGWSKLHSEAFIAKLKAENKQISDFI